MKLFAFEKYEGAGNDFIILDFTEGEFIDLNDQEFMEKLCDRHFGIGADGIIALCNEESFNFRMKYLNSDGRFSSFCGNGSRCISLYAYHKWKKKKFQFIAADGEHESEILEDDLVRVKMKNIDGIERTSQGILIQSGSPHLIQEVKDVFNYDIKNEGRKIRNAFSKEGANVNFIEIVSDHSLNIATYERGVEDETLACGTGIVASAYYLAFKNKLTDSQQIYVNAKGGNLKVELSIDAEKKATKIYLSGPARKVFSGFWKMD